MHEIATLTQDIRQRQGHIHCAAHFRHPGWVRAQDDSQRYAAGPGMRCIVLEMKA